MTGPYLPDHGERPTGVTVTRDGTHVVVCGVRLTEADARRVANAIQSHAADIRREREEAERRKAEEEREQRWVAEAVAVVSTARWGRARLLPNGRVQAERRVSWVDAREVCGLLLAAAPGRRLWWMTETGTAHLDRCGCVVGTYLDEARLLPVAEAPSRACKRSLRKLAAEVTP